MVQREEMEVAVPAGAERARDFRSEVADPQLLEKGETSPLQRLVRIKDLNRPGFAGRSGVPRL